VTTLSPEQQSQRRNLRSYPFYATKFFKIIDRDSGAEVAYKPNGTQRMLHNLTVDSWTRREPCRIWLLKARQFGGSTWVQTEFAHAAFTRKNWVGRTISHEDKSTRSLHGMTEMLWEKLPTELRPPKKSKEQGHRLYLASPWNSQLETYTAGGDGDVARSTRANALHFSEAAFYPNAEKTARSAFSLVQDVPGTLIVVESTGNGVGNWFETGYWAAVEGRNGFIPVFSPWYDDPRNTRPDLVPEKGIDDYSTRELDLVERHGVTDPQIAWRRARISSPQFGGDEDEFAVEYPATAEEAFKASGRPFFRTLSFDPVDPIMRGEFVGDGRRFSFQEDAKGPLKIWALKQPGRKYVIAVDPAGKVTKREADSFPTMRDSDDYSAITVRDAATMDKVAVWHARIDLGLLGYEAGRLGKVYNDALVGVEQTGGYGGPVIEKLYHDLGYQWVYQRETYDHVVRKTTYALGYDTNTNTRPRVLEGYRDLLRSQPGTFKDASLLREIKTFATGDDGIPRAAAGHHDDLVMSDAWACELARLHPQPSVVVRQRRPAPISGKRGRIAA
jgi:hypothetical protein